MTKRAGLVPDFRGWRAVVLHPPHPTVDAIVRQLGRLGVTAEPAWPDLDTDRAAADIVFFDADLGHDGQFPWAAGAAPMPLVALIGSEAPGRIEWMLRQEPSAHMLKPIGSAGVFGALLIACHAFDMRDAMGRKIAGLESRVRRRSQVAQALVRLMADGRSEEAAMRALRTYAMNARLTIEEAAQRLVTRPGEGGHGLHAR